MRDWIQHVLIVSPQLYEFRLSQGQVGYAPNEGLDPARPYCQSTALRIEVKSGTGWLCTKCPSEGLDPARPYCQSTARPIAVKAGTGWLCTKCPSQGLDPARPYCQSTDLRVSALDPCFGQLIVGSPHLIRSDKPKRKQFFQET
ncbi:hypothetical protein RRG08_033583 [Elysia crispata]|uniref:Uncharacterized protein n=1 Tax=Elysia crispata TaxID=231223 RepID=A0AAE0XNV6_9GAST|nr:hypothetical protein RRG08_033583 [Elysia crispata]